MHWMTRPAFGWVMAGFLPADLCGTQSFQWTPDLATVALEWPVLIRHCYKSYSSWTTFFDFHQPGNTADGHGHRFRQFLKLTVPMPSISPNLSFVVLDEIFINMNNVDTGARAGFNQNRAFGGFAYRFNKIAVGEIGYLHQYFNRPASPRPDQQQHILAVNLLLNF